MARGVRAIGDTRMAGSAVSNSVEKGRSMRANDHVVVRRRSATGCVVPRAPATEPAHPSAPPTPWATRRPAQPAQQRGPPHGDNHPTAADPTWKASRMAHTISVHDDNSRITAAMTVDDSGARPRITEIRFAADDEVSVTANDLLLVRFFGLTLPGGTAPTTSVAARALSEQPAIVPKPAAKTSPKKVPTQTRKPGAKRFNGRKPDDATLLKLWLNNDRTMSFIARKLGCSGQTVSLWIDGAKARGVEFPAKP